MSLYSKDDLAIIMKKLGWDNDQWGKTVSAFKAQGCQLF